MPRSSKACTHGEEQGVFLVLTMLLLLALLGIAGITIDSGNLFRSQQTLSESVEAAVVAGLSYRATRGYTVVNANPTIVEDRALDVLRANLEAASIDLGNTTLAATYDIITEEIEVTASYDAPLYLLPALPSFGGCGSASSRTACRVSAEASGELAPATVGLVLDASSSEACPIVDDPADPDCGCLRSFSCIRGLSRFSALSQAVRNFLAFFNPNRDRINLVPFNIVAARFPGYGFVSMRTDPELDITPIAPNNDAVNFDSVQIQNALALVNPSSQSNPCDGLITAYDDMQRAVDPVSGNPIVGNQNIFFVLFAGGAPSAGRFVYPNVKPITVTPNDYVHYTVSSGLNPGDPEQLTENFRDAADQAPAPIFYYYDMPFGHDAGQPPVGARTCGTLDVANPDVAFDCVDDIEFQIPFLDASDTFAAGAGFDEYREQYYHCAIEFSDFIREQNGVVFTAGYGTPAALTGEAYQNIDDIRGVKSVLWRRVAYDFYHARISSNDPAFDYPEYKDYPVLEGRATLHDLQGEFLLASAPEDLNALFGRAAKSILLRLVRS